MSWPGLVRSDKCIRVAVVNLVLGLEESHLIYVLLVSEGLKELEPVCAGFPYLFDGREVRGSDL